MRTPLTIALLGPESSGKTTLCAQLATHLNAVWVPEYARDYIPAQTGIYTEADLLAILQDQTAMHQAAITAAQANNTHYVLLDTEATVLAVWAHMSLGYVPPAIEQACAQQSFNHYLLLAPDLPWQADPLRSAPLLSQRQAIFTQYQHWLHRYRRPFSIISGQDGTRISNALNAINAAHTDKNAL